MKSHLLNKLRNWENNGSRLPTAVGRKQETYTKSTEVMPSASVDKEENMWSKPVSVGPTASLSTTSAFTETTTCLESADTFT